MSVLKPPISSISKSSQNWAYRYWNHQFQRYLNRRKIGRIGIETTNLTVFKRSPYWAKLHFSSQFDAVETVGESSWFNHFLYVRVRIQNTYTIRLLTRFFFPFCSLHNHKFCALRKPVCSNETASCASRTGKMYMIDRYTLSREKNQNVESQPFVNFYTQNENIFRKVEKKLTRE